MEGENEREATETCTPAPFQTPGRRPRCSHAASAEGSAGTRGPGFRIAFVIWAELKEDLALLGELWTLQLDEVQGSRALVLTVAQRGA